MRSLHTPTCPLLLLLVLCACGDSEPTAPPQPETTEITASEELDLTVEAARLRKAIGELGIDVVKLEPIKWDRTKRLLVFPVTAAQAYDTWKTLRANLASVRRWPLVVQKPNDVVGNVDRKKYPDVQPILDRAEAVDPMKWFAERESGDDYYQDPPVGTWTDAEPHTRWSFPKDYKNRPAKDLFVMLLPTVRTWEVPAWLGTGGWNDCPVPEVHVAMQKRWHEQYGVELVFATGDNFELLCPKRPDSKAAARALAREQFLYCGDLIHQGHPGTDALASELYASGTWYFWWD